MTALRYVLSGLRRRPVEALSAALAIALTVAFLASLGSFLGQTGAQLTTRAAARVPVDWQVQLTPGADASAVRAAVDRVHGLAGVRTVEYAKVAGLTSASTSGVRTTGAAYLVALPADYASFAPGEVRALLGTTSGPVLQQQTAANLAAGIGSTVRVVGRPGPAVRVTGVVDLPNADSFFQVVGAPAGSGASAPPDNVLLVPGAVLRTLVPAGTVVSQLHVRLDHAALPHDPAQAADDVTRRANRFATAVAGGALVGDDLSAALSAAREDALYSRLLVLLLGFPALVLSGAITALVLSLRNDRQRRDLGLLRLRGATPGQAARLVGGTALLDGLLGVALGAGAAVLATRLALGAGAHLSGTWLLAAALVGVALALVVELAPVVRLLRSGDAVAAQVSSPTSTRLPLPLRLGLDVLLLAASALVFWLTSRGGYTVVVVPEGVPVAAVNYAALLAPALAWPGAALLVWRLTSVGLSRPARLPATDPQGMLADLRRDVVRRRRRTVARGATGLAVAIAVTVSAAVFTRTYDQQARVDVALTVGSDVAVTLPPDSTATLDPAIARVPGVRAVEQVAHRLAYVGPDLQDLYGVDATTVGRAAPLQDAFTPGSSVQAVLRRLASTPDGVLLSQETLHDYQLHTGDLVRVRLQDRTGHYRPVPFHVVGVVTEFATAPRDSFVIANRDYLASTTGRRAVQTLLVRSDRPSQVASLIRAPAAALVNDTTRPRVAVPSASGLAAGSLAGLARLTLAFGLLLAALSAGLVLVAGAAQRRRVLVMLAVLGATPRQRAGFLWTEARALVGAGVVAGLLLATLIAEQLVKVLTGIFDPAPPHPAVPWTFLAALLAAVLASAAGATGLSARWAGRVDPSRLRDL